MVMSYFILQRLCLLILKFYKVYPIEWVILINKCLSFILFLTEIVWESSQPLWTVLQLTGSVMDVYHLFYFYRNRVRKFPAFVNCTTIDWFSEWPIDALNEVADKYLQDVTLDMDKEVWLFYKHNWLVYSPVSWKMSSISRIAWNP